MAKKKIYYLLNRHFQIVIKGYDEDYNKASWFFSHFLHMQRNGDGKLNIKKIREPGGR